MSNKGNVLFGNSLTFDHRMQEWDIFKSRFAQFCLANNYHDDTDKTGVMRRAFLLTSLAEDTYRLVRDLVFPLKLEDLAYKTLIEKIDNQFSPKKCTFAERYVFYKAEQRPGEDLTEWAARVRHLAQFCGFKIELETALRDKFVLGLANVKEKEKLFSENIDSLTFNKALELAQSVQCARVAVQRSLQEEEPVTSSATAQPVFALRAQQKAVRQTTETNTSCSVCGYKSHTKDKCRYANYFCQKCNKKGHLKRVCKSTHKSNNYLEVDDNDLVKGISYDLYNIGCLNGMPMRLVVSIASKRISCEIDSGSAVSVLPEKVYQSYFHNNYSLNHCNVILNCYNGSKISPLGYCLLPVTYENRTEIIRFYIIKTDIKQPVLLGRNFITCFNMKLCIGDCNNLEHNDLVKKLKETYSQLFTDELGTFNKYKVTLKLKNEAQLKFFKPRAVPLALKHKVELELNKLLDLGILERVDYSEVATPIVPVLRSDGNVRICGDYSVTLNKFLYSDNYPLPRIEDLFSKLHGGVQFSKLDLSRAYNQLELDDSKKLTCINTHIGLFCYNRLVFGLSCAPSIFQKTMDQLLSGIEGVCVFLDDILITAPTKEEHLKRLHQVLRKLQESGLRLKEDKCDLFKDSIEYLGFIIDKSGLRKSNNKVKAILESKCPNNVTELKSFLGLINYYRGFVPNASTLLAPLHSLLKKGVKWVWQEEHLKVFNKIKYELASDRVLAHYNPDLITIVTADAGPNGLGAVLAQRQFDGVERVVAYASRSLINAERNYAQIQKEATAIIFAIKKFHHYLYGRVTPFILRTDHKPLVSIFGGKKGIPEMVANRLQRYSIFLSAYNFTIEYVKSENNVADFLSRCSVNNCSENIECSPDQTNLIINFINDNMLKPITVNDIRKETMQDQILCKIINFVINGWPLKMHNAELKPYFKCKNDLSVENGCLLRGHKVIIPTVFRESLLKELHKAHFGIVKTKNEARSRMWWPNIDKQIEEIIGSCSICNSLRYDPPRSPLASWPFPKRPWERVHLDMFSLSNKQFLIIVDAHSKWIECFQMNNTDSEAIISKLSEIFSRFGLCRTLVTDNASNFCSKQFESFCLSNGIQHLTSPSYHPASNGQAENTVKIVKRGLRIILNTHTDQKSIINKLNEFLFSYRNSVHCTTGFSPAQLLLGRPLRCRLDLLSDHKFEQNTNDTSLSSTTNNVANKQILQSENYDGRRKSNFNKEDKVLVKFFYNNGNDYTWKFGVVKNKLGNRLFTVFVPELNKYYKKHVDHMVAYKGNKNEEYDLDLGNFENLSNMLSADQANCNVKSTEVDTITSDSLLLRGEEGESSGSKSDKSDQHLEVPMQGLPPRSTRNPNPKYKFKKKII